MVQRSPVLFLVLAAGAATAIAAPPTQPMSVDQVHCHADRLQALLDRTDLLFGDQFSIRGGAAAPKPVALLWTDGSPAADPVGYAYSTQWTNAGALGPEKHLVVDLNVHETPLGRDPSTALVPTYTLARDVLASDARQPGDVEALTISVNPVRTLTPPLGYRLRVGNVRTAAVAETKRGEGLAAALAPCDAVLSVADVHALRVLASVLRPLLWIEFGSSSESPERATFAVLYRGAAADPIPGGARTSFRLDAAPPDEPERRLAVELLIDIADDGALGAASMRLLPPCTAAGERDCSGPNEFGDATLQVIHPVAAGQLWNEPEAPTLCLLPDDHLPCTSGPVTFDFAERLRDTRWLRP